ncbi:MAG: ComEC/Rec2 family competence protein, partial [Tenericutes bacterium]|nr:ComEC/Rec2 family competence protein [Mycoplasmatota bacterium]
MLKLRTILLSKYLYYGIFIIALIYTSIILNIPKTSNYKTPPTIISGTITSLTIIDNYLKITLKSSNESFILSYTFKNIKEQEEFKKTYHLGNEILVKGEATKPKNNSNFNYQKYLERKNIYYLIKVKEYSLISSEQNIYYFFKEKIAYHLHNNSYLYTFIYGDKSYISKEVIRSYQTNGISHLFAISGMHITLLSSLILKLLKKLKVKENTSYFITIIFLLFYLLLVGPSASILRGVLFFILFSLNKIYYFYIKPFHLFLLVLSISLIFNPFFIYDLGFLYSFSISLALIETSSYLQGNYFISLLKTSLISFLVSIPIGLYNFSSLNFLSIIYNLFFVPLISIIIFPLSLILVFCPFLLPIYNFLINILESLSLFLSKISLLTFTFRKINIVFYFLYYPLIILFINGLIKKEKIKYLPLIIILLIHYSYPFFINEIYVKVQDVGQGDSIIIHSNNCTILLDTGTSNDNNYSLSANTTIPTLKKLGIKKIDYLLLSHGDKDHMGEAINLVENFKVDKVIFNCGEFNELEKDLIKVLDKKKIPYYSCIKELNIDDNKLYFLNNKDY